MKKTNIKHLLIILSCTGMAISSMGIINNTSGVFYTPVCIALNASRGTVSLSSTLTTIFQGFLGPFVNKFYEKFNAKKIMFCATMITVISTIVLAFTNNIFIFLLCSIFRGFGSSWFFYPIITIIVGNWFVKNKSTIIGGVMSLSGLTGAVLSPVFGQIIETHDYKIAYVLSALILLLSCLPSILFLKLRPEENELLINSEEVNEAKTVKTNKNYICYEPFSPIYFFMVVMFISCALLSGLPQHLSGFAETINQSGIGSFMLSAVMFGNLAFKFIVGRIIDVKGPRVGIYFIFATTTLSSIIFLLFPRTPAIMIFSSFIYGVAYSVAVSSAALMFDIYGKKQYAKANVNMSVFISTGAAIAITIVGAIYDYTKSYNISFICMLTLSLIGIACNIIIKRLEDNKRKVDL